MMTDDLKAIINKNLPSLAAGEMSKYIEQAEKEKEELKSFKFNTEVLNKQISNLTQQFQLLKSNESKVISKSLELATKEEELKIREFNYKVAELTYQLASEKSAKNDIFKLVETFVKNPRAIEIISGSEYNTMGSAYDPNLGKNVNFVQSSIKSGNKEIKEEK
jgi:hypothetical protein